MAEFLVGSNFSNKVRLTEDRPEPSQQQDFPKGVISAQVNALDANSARQLKECFGRNAARTRRRPMPGILSLITSRLSKKVLPDT